LLGAPAGTVGVRRKVGYLPEDHQFPGYHTGYSLMDFYGSLYGVPAADRAKKIPEALDMVGIAGRMHSKIKTYSKGMKQRLGIAQALMHEPDLIILDEPTDGVVPVDAVTAPGFPVRPLPDHAGHFEVTLTDGKTIEPVMKLLSERGLTVIHIVEKKQSLEDVFMTTVEGAEPGVDRQRRRRARPV